MRTDIGFIALALLCAGCSGDGEGKDDTGDTDLFAPVLLDPAGVHYGQTLEQWGVTWWLWALELQGDNPLVDNSGAFCANGQSGDVFFLAGTTGGAAARSCTVPAGKALLFPIVNSVVDNSFVPDPTSPDWRDEATLVEAVDVAMAKTTGMALDIDGTTWTHDELFELLAGPTVFAYTLPPEPNFYTACCSASIVGTVDPAVTGGFWAMIDPLPAGEHEITFSGLGYYGDYEVPIDTTYHLTVE